MRILIAGGHGKIALLLEKILSDAGHDVIGMVRNAEHAPELKAAGASALVLDLERMDAATLATHLTGIFAVVFAAGAGPGSPLERKLAVDRDGAILLAEAAELAGIRRYVLVSSVGTDRADHTSTDPFQVYLRAKAEADENIRARALDWTIVQPAALTDEPGTGLVRIGHGMREGSIPRADVASLLARLITTGAGIRRQFEVRSGSDPLATVHLD